MNFSEVKMNDAEALLRFCHRLKHDHIEMTFADADSIEEIQGWIEDPLEHMFMLREANNVVALLKAKQGADGQDHSASLSAAVVKSRRGEGLVNQLTKQTYPLLKERGVQVIRAFIYSNNAASINAILREGFHCSGSVVMHHKDSRTGDWVDDLIFHKKL